MATIKDVARLAGVSTATVSRTLAEPYKVAEATRARVDRAVKQSGYVVNTLARNFRRRRTNVVLVLVPDISNPFYSAIIRGIERLALEHGYRILLGDTQNEMEREMAYSELVSLRQADGMICLGMDIPFTYRKGRKTMDPKWPPFVMACEYNGVIPAPTVCIDNYGAAVDAVRHLLELGHERIAFINGPAESPLCKDRLAGFHGALRSAKVRVLSEWLRNGDFSIASGYTQMQAILSLDQWPTALFCANDEMAIGALQAAREHGIRLPEELSVVGFDDISFAAYACPPLTTVRQPREQMGEQIMKLMLDVLDMPGKAGPKIVVQHELVVRSSTVQPGLD